MTVKDYSAQNETAKHYREAMANVAAAVHVITTDGAAGRYGITMTAVTSVTDTPPTMLLCINRKATIQPILRANGALCINILAQHQRKAADFFSGMMPLPPEERFAHHEWTQGESGQWQLEGALANLHGEIAEMRDMGSHTVFYVSVGHIRIGAAQDKPLLYFRRRFVEG